MRGGLRKLRQKCRGGGVKPSAEEVILENVPENAPDEEAGIAPLAETDMEPRAVGGTLEYTYEGRNLKYTITKEDGDSKEVEVVGEEPDRAGYLLSIPIIIPESIQVEQDDGTTTTYTVTGIGEGAFHNYAYTSSATIPGSVKSIGKQAFMGCEKLKEITIGSGVESIGEQAFSLCKILEKVTIPSSVKSIGRAAFNDCSGLTEITIKNGVESIGQGAFAGCSGLTEVTIPDSVTSIGNRAFLNCTKLTDVTISKNVKEIKEYTFSGCSSLTEVVIPNSVTTLEQCVFYMCSSLGKVTLSEKALPIANGMFSKCTSLTKLNIAISSDKKADFCSTNLGAFENCPGGRKVYFLSADGKQPLTGTDWESAKQPYQNAPDGDTTDNLWYGWLLEEPTEVKDTYAVTITVRKDDDLWDGHGKTFALLPASGSGGDFLEVQGAQEGSTYKISKVPNGTYSIFDITGGSATTSSMARAAGTDTDVDVTVQDGNAEAEVNYYTATFYDRDAAGNEVEYGIDTDQRPQIILSGRKVEPPVSNPTDPKDPSKMGWVFDVWKTEAGGDYNFEAGIGEKQKIYASWRSADTPPTPVTYRITVLKDGEGSISPSGPVVSVNKGDSAQFIITPAEGYRIKSVMVDGVDRTAELADTPGGDKSYTFTNVTGAHTIRVEFEREGGDTPNPNPDPGGDNPGGGDNPAPGGDGGNTNPGGGSSSSGGGGSSSDSGGGDNGGGDTNPDGGNGAGDGQAGAETASLQAGSDASAGSSAASDGGAAAGGATESAVSGAAAGASGQTAGVNGAAGGKEPKTGDTAYWEVYATLAMVAGLTYLLLYIMEESRGMTEREKEAAVAALIRWGKKGGSFRKCCAMAAIFGLLMYYHAIGKRAGESALRDRYLGQAS